MKIEIGKDEIMALLDVTPLGGKIADVSLRDGDKIGFDLDGGGDAGGGWLAGVKRWFAPKSVDVRIAPTPDGKVLRVRAERYAFGGFAVPAILNRWVTRMAVCKVPEKFKKCVARDGNTVFVSVDSLLEHSPLSLELKKILAENDVFSAEIAVAVRKNARYVP